MKKCYGICERPRLLKEIERCRANKDRIVDVTEYTKRIAELEVREQVWSDYVAFLGESIPYSYLLAHGWRCPEEDVERGKRFREKLGIEGTGGGE